MVTSALKIGTEGTGGGRGCFMEGEQEGLSRRETLEQPAVCPTWGPRFIGRVTAEPQGGNELAFEGWQGAQNVSVEPASWRAGRRSPSTMQAPPMVESLDFA